MPPITRPTNHNRSAGKRLHCYRRRRHRCRWCFLSRKKTTSLASATGRMPHFSRGVPALAQPVGSRTIESTPEKGQNARSIDPIHHSAQTRSHPPAKHSNVPVSNRKKLPPTHPNTLLLVRLVCSYYRCDSVPCLTSPMTESKPGGGQRLSAGSSFP